jgi:putative zinc finger/helix-turn-helix YgiT family protein
MVMVKCPANHEKATLKNAVKKINFRGEQINVPTEYYQCLECDHEFATVKQTVATQKAIADAYRKKVRLLTSEEIKQGRAELGISQNQLAKKINVGVASIKRWEGTQIQSKAMNVALINGLNGNVIGNIYTGNRVFSIPRIKLVMDEFEKQLNEPFLKDGDMMLFDAKYAWYADMLAYRETGRSITGGTYASLPHGPQLNNYKELVDLIREAGGKTAQPLTKEEKRIICKIAKTFPTKRAVYDATHREEVWREKTDGSLIPYSDAAKLTQI